MTDPIEHILVPSDGSEAAQHAAGVAGMLARALGARVTVLVVHPDEIVPALAWNAAIAVDQVRAQYERETSETTLASTLEAVGQLPAKAESIQRWGHPADTICAVAEERGADLIVMGSHGRSGLKRMVLGSVSHAVTIHAACPVTIVR